MPEPTAPPAGPDAAWFAPDQLPALHDFWAIYDAHYDAIGARTTLAAEGHPEFGAVVRAMSRDALDAQQRESRERLRRAVAGSWEEYEARLRQEGSTYAQMGISFAGWYDLVRSFQADLVELLIEAYGASPARLAGALKAMQRFLDCTMSILGEEYLAAKERIVVQQRELAERRAAELGLSEEALRRQTTILSSVLDCMRDGLVVCDEEGKTILLNRAGAAIMGSGSTPAPPAAAPGGPMGTFRPDGVTPVPRADMPIFRAAAGESCDDVELLVRNERLPGGVRVSVDGRPLRDAEGAVKGGVATFRDVTERRRLEQVRRAAEEAVRSSEERYRLMFESSPLPMWLFDTETLAFLAVNDAAVLHYGYSREEFAAMTLADIRAPEDVPRLLAVTRDGGTSAPSLWRHRTKGGAEITVEVRAHAFTFAGRPARLVLANDVTERAKLEEARARSVELEAQNQRIVEANRLKSEFLANMSHELRTPLNSIIGFAEILHDGQVPHDAPEHQEFLGDILKSGRHLLQLINDVLDLAKVEAGKLELFPEPVDLGALVREIVTLLRTIAAARRVEVKVEIDPSLGPVVLDPARLKQVLYNYLSNALKFSPEGGHVVVRVRAEGPARFRLEVQDDGPGIAAGDLGRLFVEFLQLDGGASKRHAGTGLGLALTKRLVEAQGGSVGVRSAPGEGSTFHAVLDRVTGATPAPAAPSPTSPGRPGAPSVLVIEDDLRDQAVLVRILEREGYRVTTATAGSRALALCAERAFDAITLDLLLADTSGLDLLRSLRAGGKNRETPVVVVTVVAEKSALAGFRVHDILQKPLDPAALVLSLKRAKVSPAPPAPVLVVDDDPSALRLMGVALAQLGYEPVCRQGGAAALDDLAGTSPIAVVLDILMPGMDGFEFLDRFRRAPGHRHTPVMIWTVKDLTAAERARLAVSAQAVVLKGDGAAALLEDLQAILAEPARAAGG